MADQFRDLGVASKAFVLAVAVIFAIVMALLIYAAFLLEGPVTVAPRAVLVLTAAAAILRGQNWFGRSIKQALEHMQSPVGRIQKAIRDSRGARKNKR